MNKRNFVTIADLSREKILYMIKMAEEFEKHPNREILKGKVVATLFYEPSTRTRLSFETAANRLGARVIGFSDAKASSVSKGETLKDTILMVSITVKERPSMPVRFLPFPSSMPEMVHTSIPHNACSTSTPSIRPRAPWMA